MQFVFFCLQVGAATSRMGGVGASLASKTPHIFGSPNVHVLIQFVDFGCQYQSAFLGFGDQVVQFNWLLHYLSSYFIQDRTFAEDVTYVLLFTANAVRVVLRVDSVSVLLQLFCVTRLEPCI